jgi:HK97 family phage portal protein
MPLMRSVLDRLLPSRRAEPVEGKASAAGALVAMQSMGEPVWSPRNYASYAVEGFQQNAIVHRSVRMIAEAAASIPLLLYEGDSEIEVHPLIDLMRRPSVGMTSTDLLEQFYGYLLVSGNAYMEAVAIGGEVRELHALRPDRMRIVPGPDGWPEAWEYEVAGRVARFADDVVEGVRPILHLRLFHPTNDHYGLSPIEAAATAIDIHNEASRWNKALLDNSARPSGALVYAAANGQLTGEQFERLKRELEASYQGAANVGRPLLLEGGLDWKPLSLSPKDMDFIEAKHAAAREIALAIGVPPMLLGIPGDNTYSNYQEAARALWRQTVLPLVARTTRALSAWLAPAYGGALEFRADLDQVEALAPEREALWARLEAASFLTEAEKRAAAGYGDTVAGTASTRLAKFNPHHDALGRFTTADGAGGGANDDGLLHLIADEGDKFAVELSMEEQLGGHTVRDHVDVSDARLLEIVKTSVLHTPSRSYYKIAQGSFLSKEAANDFVNQLLQSRKSTVEAVSKGLEQDAWLEMRFGYRTGKEAFRPEPNAEPYIRATYNVGVYIQHQPRIPKGYIVRTAYPLNDYPVR